MKVEAKTKIRQLCQVAVIAAVYAVLTVALAPISFGPLQVRVSEAMCVFAFFTPAAVPGLFIGCLIANLTTAGLGILDIIFGSLATLAAAGITYTLRGKNRWFAPLPSVLVNAFVVAWILVVQYGVPTYWLNVATVGIGQAIACYGIGMPLLYLLEKNRKVLFLNG